MRTILHPSLVEILLVVFVNKQTNQQTENLTSLAEVTSCGQLPKLLWQFTSHQTALHIYTWSHSDELVALHAWTTTQPFHRDVFLKTWTHQRPQIFSALQLWAPHTLSVSSVLPPTLFLFTWATGHVEENQAANAETAPVEVHMHLFTC